MQPAPTHSSVVLTRTRRFEVLLEQQAGRDVGAPGQGDHPVVVKQLRTDRLLDERAARRLRTEAAILRGLRHDAVVRLVTLEDRTARPRLLLEYLEGPTLADHFRDHGRLSEQEAALLLATLGSALAHVHGHGLVHGDVKPRNVILAPRGPVLIDFDLARTPGPIAGSLGTRLFRAPEQARCECVQPASDVWSLGVVAYRALVGELPFRGAGLPQLAASAPRLSRTPLGALVASTLAADPHARPSAGDLTAATTALLERHFSAAA